MDAFSDDDYERISDIDLSEPESEGEEVAQRETPSSTPPSTHRSVRASDRKTIRCTYAGCPKTFNRKARLEEHLRSHTNDRIFKCNFARCDKDFLRETHLKHHVKSAHSDIRDYQCTWEACDKSFATGTRLRRHLQAHEGREKYRCRGYDGCNETFRKHETLKRHVLQVHEQMRPFPCVEVDAKTGKKCDKGFHTAEKLRAHQRSKHDATKFSCAECLARQAAHGESSDGHKSEAPAETSVYFATYSALQAHIAEAHPPTCPYCPTSFTTFKELTRHLEIQHDIIEPSSKPNECFQCSYPGCDRSFSKRGNLNVHVRTVHEKKKDFICGETELITPEDLLRQGPVQVFGCGRAFTSKASLEDHVRSAHLGLKRLQVQRRDKRKADKQEACGDDTDQGAKKRRPRKDKGVKKTSIISGLTAAPSKQADKIYDKVVPGYAYTDTNVQNAQVSPSSQVDVKLDSDDEENDDWNQLSGSMTLIGTRLYHNGEEFEYSDHQSVENSLSGSGTYSRIAPGRASGIDDEPFFDNFEHEPESIHSVLDPALMHL